MTDEAFIKKLNKEVEQYDFPGYDTTFRRGAWWARQELSAEIADLEKELDCLYLALKEMPMRVWDHPKWIEALELKEKRGR